MKKKLLVPILLLAGLTALPSCTEEAWSNMQSWMDSAFGGGGDSDSASDGTDGDGGSLWVDLPEASLTLSSAGTEVSFPSLVGKGYSLVVLDLGSTMGFGTPTVEAVRASGERIRHTATDFLRYDGRDVVVDLGAFDGEDYGASVFLTYGSSWDGMSVPVYFRAMRDPELFLTGFDSLQNVSGAGVGSGDGRTSFEFDASFLRQRDVDVVSATCDGLSDVDWTLSCRGGTLTWDAVLGDEAFFEVEGLDLRDAVLTLEGTAFSASSRPAVRVRGASWR